MPRQIQRYITGLLVEILGPADIERRFDWCRGDSRVEGTLGRPLPFDAVWDDRKLIIEIDEKQHRSAVPFFDKSDVITVSGVPRGLQRRLYDERKARLASQHGYTLVRVPDTILVRDGRRMRWARAEDRTNIARHLAELGVTLGR